ncbi:MAG: hypothetical protein AB7U81_11970 [Thiohalomonadaceae bacterium]
MDQIDQASEFEQLRRNAALAQRKPTAPAPCGECHFCGASLDDPAARWCDADCRDRWERRQRAHNHRPIE